MRRVRLASLVLLAATLFSVPAAADRTGSCIAAADRGQLARDRGALRDARTELLACADPTCPAVVRVECARWVSELEPRIPSLVVRATGPRGEDVADVRVLVDGQLVKDALDGRAIDVDPGIRDVRVERAGSDPVDVSLLVYEGEKARAVDVRFAPLPAPVAVAPRPLGPPVPPRSIPAGSFVLGGIGVLGIGAFTFMALDLESDVDGLRATCAPACDPRDVDAARTQAWLTNGSLVVGIVALAAAGVLAFTSNSGSRATALPSNVARAGSRARSDRSRSGT